MLIIGIIFFINIVKKTIDIPGCWIQNEWSWKSTLGLWSVLSVGFSSIINLENNLWIYTLDFLSWYHWSHTAATSKSLCMITQIASIKDQELVFNFQQINALLEFPSLFFIALDSFFTSNRSLFNLEFYRITIHFLIYQHLTFIFHWFKFLINNLKSPFILKKIWNKYLK